MPYNSGMTHHNTPGQETFEAFKNSFSYGTRTDLLFKFLKNLSEGEAAGFIREMFERIGAALDDGDFDRVVQHLYEGQVQAYTPGSDAKPRWVYESGPFATLPKPLPDCRIGLVSSGGHFVRGEDPAPFGVTGMTQNEAVERINDFLRAGPQLTEIPTDVAPENLEVRHGGYDIRGAQADHNVVLPIDPLRRAEGEGRIGRLHPAAYTFVGATAQLRLLNESGPRWVDAWKRERIDALVLVPV